MADLTLRRFRDLDAFEASALPFLTEREAEHNLFIGICSEIRAGRYADFYLVAAERAGAVVAAAFRTPPHQLGLSHIADRDAIAAIAGDAFEEFGSLPGVLGAKDAAISFAQAWQGLTGKAFSIGMEQRIYEATQAIAPTGVPGEMRPATDEDRGLLVDWVQAFHDEVGGIMTGAEEVVDVRLRAQTGGLVVWWHDREPVSIAGFGGPTPSGARLGPVYTPPELRRRGYATACVAELTQQLLDGGRRFVFLFTDLANPTSNSIYQQIGYRPVCDVDQYRFAS